MIGPGDDREAIEKSRALEEVGANVRWLRDVATLRDDDVKDAFLVISTPYDAALSARLRGLADRYRFLLCCIDQPAYGFVAMQAIVKAGPARITVSTGGVSPAVSKRLREAFEAALDSRFVRFLDALRAKRTQSRALEDAKARKAAGREAAKGFDVQVSVRYPPWFE